MSEVYEKGPGKVKGYGEGKVKKLKLQADGNPFPYEREYIAESGVQDDEKIVPGEGDYEGEPKVLKNIGDNGRG